ncbi:hypothetical protein DFH27DRAFT_195182 [Peziza echinospora]|nr:hypothetical protein DFH27DRAFT_195182 [Peziza echinospora]
MCDKLSPVLSMVLEHIDPSSVLAMLKVCKRWRHRLMNPFGSYYHLHVWKNFPYTKPGPAWRFEVFWNTALKHKAVKDGSLHLVGRIPLLDQHQHEVGGYSKRLFWYHSGLVCFYQPWEVNKVALYDLKNMKPGIPVPPKYFSANPRAYIVSANVGGTPNSGTYLVYCVYQHRKKPTQIFCHLIDESSATKSSENKGKRRDIPLQAKILNIPEEHEILFKAQGAIQTNGSTVVLVTKSKILAWDITGGRFLGFQFLNNRDGRMENLKIGQIWISETLVFVISWVPDFGSWVTAFSLKNLTLVEDFGLGKCGPIYQISSSLSGNRLFVARAFPNEEHVIKGSWTQSCLDNSGVSEGRPIECRDVPDFPSFKDAVHARIISYPDHGRALIARQAGFGQNSPESELLMVEVGTGKIIKAVHSAKGYNTALMIDDGLKLTRKLVQGDTEWVVWCTRGELLVFHFSSKESDAIYTHLSSIPSSVSSSPFEHCQFDD